MHTGAACAGVVNLTKTLAIEWVLSGTRINSVASGTIYSPTSAANYPTDVLEKAKKEQPTGRLGDTEEISSVVCFLCPTAYYIVG